ncbi:phosphofructokinase [Neiella marina]|uniref:Phosphofructokinase n=1 Tax=Neiella marina TaxID=508461 RepID=A0A8J2XP05_9GAMM|nr:1-phosphofructokinase family hexose kinase [Neiella marina]GGA76321.1 phosphofructokinase [Neiella marina]
MRHVITVTLNPALDQTGNLQILKPGAVNLIERASLRPAGKGINVACVLAQLGQSVIVTGFLGSDNDNDFVELFKQWKMTDAFVRVPGNTRVNVKLAESNGRVTDVNFPSFEVAKAYQKELIEQLTELVNDNSLVVIAGSLPRGVDPGYIQQLIGTVKANGGKVYVDTSGAALKAAVLAEPDLLKPNIDEFAELVGESVSKTNLPALVNSVCDSSVQTLVVSAGRDGLYSFGPFGQHQCLPPKVEIESTVGAGDTLVAGLSLGWLTDSSTEKCLIRASALAAWAVTQHGVDVPSAQKLEQLMAEVEFKALEQGG